ncbi:MAG: FAD-binding oxidoreductase [Steroidobacteraceae bacterium]
MQAVPQDPHVVAGVIATLRRLLGEQHVLTDHAEREFYSQDVYRAGQLPAAVIRPGSVEELAAALQAIAPAGLPLVPRGGGMSYTDGFLPAQHDSITLDLLRLDRVLEINPDDCYVTVECGATWKRLCDALEPHGVRTPYYGPLSGLYATIGGALSQGSVFLGSGRYGTAADSVIGLDVMLADGSILKLGSHANRNGQPFFRQVGPDTMAMFLSDSGSLGIKLRASFRLVRPQRESRNLSFCFDTAAQLFGAMGEVAREDVASEQFAIDPALQAVRLKRVSLREDARALGQLVKGTGGLKGLVEGAKVVMAGRGFLEEGKFSAHVSLDGRDAVDADAKAAIVRRVMGSFGGAEVENTVPKMMRANPFAEVNNMLGPGGERWVPVHGTVPFSEATKMWQACEAVFARHAAAMTAHGITHGYLSSTVGQVGTLVEPVLFWPDARLAFHERVLDAAYLAKLPKHPPNPPAAAAVARLREDLATAFMQAGAVSFQLGKFYRYQDGLEPTAAAFLKQLKQLVDPQGRMNPGGLGL